MSLLGALFALINSAGYPAFAGATPAQQAAFGAQVQLLGSQLAWLLPLPRDPATVGGFVQWRAFGFFSIVFAAWAVVSACGAVRKDEEHGLVAAWLAAGASRAEVALSRAGAFALVSAVVVVLTALATLVGTASAGQAVHIGGLLAVTADLWIFTLACYGISALIA